MIAEAPLAGQRLQRLRLRRRAALFGAGFAGAALLAASALWWQSYRRNLDYVDTVRTRVEQLTAAHRLAGIGKPRAGVAALFAARAPGRERWHRSERTARRLRIRAVPGAAAGALGGAGLPRDARSQPGAAAHRALAPRPARGRGQRDALRGAARFIDARQPGSGWFAASCDPGPSRRWYRRAAPENAPNGRAMSRPCSSAAGCPRRCAPTMPGCARRAAPSRRCRWRSACTSACCDAFPTPSRRRICRRASARPAPSCSQRRAPGRCRQHSSAGDWRRNLLPALEATLR